MLDFAYADGMPVSHSQAGNGEQCRDHSVHSIKLNASPRRGLRSPGYVFGNFYISNGYMHTS